MGIRENVMAQSMLTVAITVPGNAAPVTLYSLISAALTTALRTQDEVLGFNIKGTTVAGAAREAILLGDSASNLKSYFAESADAFPPVADPGKVFISAVAAGTTATTVEVYLK